MISAASVFLLSMGSIMTYAQSSNPVSFMVEEWKRAREYTKEYLEAMPEEGYSFKPVPEVKSFGQQFLHLAGANLRYASVCIGKPDPNPSLKVLENDPTLQSKASTTKMVLESYDFVIEALKSLSPTQLQEKVVLYEFTLTKELVFFKAFEHQTHHRGQTTIYFRSKGLKPPGERLF